MAHNRKLEELTGLLPLRNKDLGLYVKHTFESLEKIEQEHREWLGAQALAGIKQRGPEESMFYDTLRQLREQMLATLEWTVEDLQHKGDKHYAKHFADGVE